MGTYLANNVYFVSVKLYVKRWQGFPGGSVVKNLPANPGVIREAGWFSGSGRSTGRRHDNPLQYSYLENPTDRGAWWATVLMITKSWL